MTSAAVFDTLPPEYQAFREQAQERYQVQITPLQDLRWRRTRRANWPRKPPRRWGLNAARALPLEAPGHPGGGPTAGDAQHSRKGSADLPDSRLAQMAQASPRGRVNSALALPLDSLRRAYLDLPDGLRDGTWPAEGHTLSGSVAALLPGVAAPKYERVDFAEG